MLEYGIEVEDVLTPHVEAFLEYLVQQPALDENRRWRSVSKVQKA